MAFLVIWCETYFKTCTNNNSHHKNTTNKLLYTAHEIQTKMAITKTMFPLRIELRTFRVLSGCDNHYTTETGQIGNNEYTTKFFNCIKDNISQK